MMTHIPKHASKLLFFLFFLGIFCLPQFASAQVHDPLKKPDIWAKLKINPADEELWKMYFGKKEMSDDDHAKMDTWKKQLSEVSKPTTTRTDTKSTNNIETWNDLQGWEEMIMEDRNEIIKLKSNVSANFLLIEELFGQIYEELDLSYKPYEEVHADNKYPKTKWVEEHESKIQAAKEKKLEEFKKRNNIKN
jgi:signal recognition particle subunit SEC65